MKNTNDPLELYVSLALDRLGIAYCCPDQMRPNMHTMPPLDFYLPELQIYIECKAWGSARIHRQVEEVNNCIVLIGMEATKLFCAGLERINSNK